MMISFLGPIKNDWGKVPALLDSIRRMFKIGSYEIILVDDGSDLTNQQILSNVVSKYPEITLLKNENTLGVIASVNRISKAARGDLLIPINADIRFRSRFYLFYIIFVFSILRKLYTTSLHLYKKYLIIVGCILLTYLFMEHYLIILNISKTIVSFGL